MKSHSARPHSVLLSLAALGLAGCCDWGIAFPWCPEVEPTSIYPSEWDCPPAESRDKGNFDELDVPTRRVEKLSASATCPASVAWSLPSAGGGHQPYDYGKDWQVVPLELQVSDTQTDRYCIYEYAGSDAAIPDLVPNCAFSAHTWPDYQGVAASGNEAEIASYVPQAVGKVAAWPTPPANPADVVLTIVDSAPDNQPGQAFTPPDAVRPEDHGGALAYIARDLLCDNNGANCKAQIATRQALSAPGGGGAPQGTLLELTQALQAEIGSWTATQMHVVNLSLGWHAKHTKDNCVGTALDPAADAVASALAAAKYKDGLVIAAGGNYTGPNNSSDPYQEEFLLPAAWWEHGADWPCGSAAPAAEPLKPIYAVNALGASGQISLFNRPNTATNYWAYGDHVTVRYQTGPDQYTPGLTGTSAAALVASVAAGALWYHKPGLTTSGDLMNELYGNTSPVTGSANGHWIKICDGLATPGTSCSTAASTAPGAPSSPMTPTLAAPVVSTLCGGDVFYPGGGTSGPPPIPPYGAVPNNPRYCPHLSYPSPLSGAYDAGGQGPTDDCPYCIYDNGYVTLEDLDTAIPYRDVVLTVFDSAGIPAYLALPNFDATPYNLDLRATAFPSSGVTAAQITTVHDNNGTDIAVVRPLFVP